MRDVSACVSHSFRATVPGLVGLVMSPHSCFYSAFLTVRHDIILTALVCVSSVSGAVLLNLVQALESPAIIEIGMYIHFIFRMLPSNSVTIPVPAVIRSSGKILTLLFYFHFRSIDIPTCTMSPAVSLTVSSASIDMIPL